MNKKTRIKLIRSINKQALYSEVLYKQAGVEDFLSNNFSTLIDKNNPFDSILNLLGIGSATIFFGPLSGIIVTFLGYFGIDLSFLLSKIKEVLKYFFDTKPTISTGNVDTHAEALASKVTEGLNIPAAVLEQSVEQVTANDFNLYGLQKTAGFGFVDVYNKKNNQINVDILKKIFGMSDKATGAKGGFLRRLIFFIIKALFLGGITAAGVGFITENAPKPLIQTPGQAPQVPGQALTQPSGQVALPKNTLLAHIEKKYPSSGKGQQIHKNDADEHNNGRYAWFITSTDLNQTIYDWIFEIYPDIPDNIENVIYNNYEKIINPLLNDIQKYNPENINDIYEIRIPNSFTSRKQIVDHLLSSLILQ